MTPYEQAQAIYAREPCYRTFAEDLELHLRHGWVFSTPQVFAMGRPVTTYGTERQIIDPAHSYEDLSMANMGDLIDCWHIHVLAGSLARALPLLPYELPFMSFQRRNVLKIWPLASIRRLCPTSR